MPSPEKRDREYTTQSKDGDIAVMSWWTDGGTGGPLYRYTQRHKKVNGAYVPIEEPVKGASYAKP